MSRRIREILEEKSPILFWLEPEEHRQVKSITLELIPGILVKPDTHFKTGLICVTLIRQRKIAQGFSLEVVEGYLAISIDIANPP